MRKRQHRSDAGFSLAALIFFAAAASIALAAAVPAYQFQARREQELELIFRGEEYVRAIQKYQRRFGVYPTTIDQLVATNGLRFLRKAYKDPITGKDFRLITINPDGSVSGSKLLTQNSNNQPSLFGNTVGQGQNPGQRQTTGQGQNLNNNPSQGFSSQSQQSQQPFGGGTQPRAQTPGQQTTGTTGFGTSTFSTPLGQTGQRGQPTGLGQSVGTPAGFAGIIGVASDSDKESIIVYNTRQKYAEWEFIAVLNQQQAVPGQNPQPVNPNQPNQTPGGQRQNSPFQTPPQNPFGGTPTTSPFGPVGGQRPTTPGGFGFGGTPQSSPGKLP